MKYLVVVASGLATADAEPDESPTPLADATTPNLDRIAQSGRQGTCALTDIDGDAGAHAAARAIFGITPRDATLAPGPTHAAAHRVPLRPETWAFCASFITCDGDGTLVNPTAGGVGVPEAQRLLSDLKALAQSELGPIADGLRFIPGDGTTNIIVDDADRSYEGLVTRDPVAARGHRIADAYPGGSADESVPVALINLSAEMLAAHEINDARRAAGDPDITHLWPWGPGRTAGGRTFFDRFGLSGAVVSASSRYRGLGSLLEMSTHDVHAIPRSDTTSRYDALVRRSLSALAESDVVFVEAPVPTDTDELDDREQRTRDIEVYDAELIGPLLARLDGEERARVMVLPDAIVPACDETSPTATVPFAMAGVRITSVVQSPFTERNSASSDLHIRRGADLLEYFLYGGGMRARER